MPAVSLSVCRAHPNAWLVQVNEENKQEFVRLMVEWRLSRSSDRQMRALASGYETAPVVARVPCCRLPWLTTVFPTGSTSWCHCGTCVALRRGSCSISSPAVANTTWCGRMLLLLKVCAGQVAGQAHFFFFFFSFLFSFLVTKGRLEREHRLQGLHGQERSCRVAVGDY